MQRIYLLFLVLFSLGFSQFTYAQERNCAAMPVLDRLLEQDPAMRQRMEQIERFTQQYIERGVELRAETVVTIPVVVHVVYNTSAQNISAAQVQSQIQVLNEDFRRLNADRTNTPADFQPVAADIGVEFCLASVDPAGNPTSGITRTSTTKTSFGTNDAVKFDAQGGKNAWPADQYLNIWVCVIGGGILGYAQFPGGAAATDGVVIDYRYFGTTGTASAPFDLGRTATHEVGHWLNLRHIWGDGPCQFDDFVDDTPAAGGPNYTGAPCTYPGPNSCTGKGKDKGNDLPDMFQNYMDYSDDGCMNLFTFGQRDRMQALFAPGGDRAGLLHSIGCGGTPPATEICDNGIDDDGDNLVDCDDPDCSASAACQPTGSCDAPTGLSSTPRKNGREAILAWNAVPGASSYGIRLRTVGSANWSTGTATTNSITATGLTKGVEYEWCVSANCGSAGSPESCKTFVAGSSGREGLAIDESLFVYPNPASDLLVVSLQGLPATTSTLNLAQGSTFGQYILFLSDMTGRTLRRLPITDADNPMELNVGDLAPGLYLLRVTGTTGELVGAKKVSIVR